MYALGGTVTHVGQYRIHTFLTTGSFTVTEAGNVEVLIVGGGGGGYQTGGGGGGIVYHPNLSVSNGSNTITVGGGGAGSSSNGGNSSAFSMTAIGGGLGASSNNATGSTGGNGGGAGRDYGTPGGTNQGSYTGATVYGYRGGYASGTSWGGGGGGGGGSGVGGTGVGNGNANGEIGGDGAAGRSFSISGNAVLYAAGGGAGTGSTSSIRAGYGGAGGGGAGNMTGTGGAGTANTGSGGGGGQNAVGGAGGSGIVIIRYSVSNNDLLESSPDLQRRRVTRNPQGFSSFNKKSFNIAFRKQVTTSASSTTSLVTDNDFTSANYYGLSGSSYVQIDLQDIYMVDQINMWHYYADLRTYYYNSVQISLDGTNWTTVFDSEVDGRYVETNYGKTVRFDVRPVRYVRNNVNGSSANTGSHWVELQVMAYPK